MRTLRSCYLLLLSCPLILTGGQPISDESNEVQLLVMAIDRKGAVVTDLQAEDLVLREENKPQAPLSLKPASASPRAVALLLDVSRSREITMPGAECPSAAAFFRKALSPKDQGMVVAFNEEPVVIEELTSDVARLEAAALRACKKRPRGSTAFFKAVENAAESKLRSFPGLKTIIVVSDGQENASDMKLKGMVQQLQRHAVSVFVVRLASDFWRGRVEREATRLTRTLSEQTGGFAVEVREPRGFENAFEKIAAAFVHSHILTYTPTHSVRDGTYRRIRLESTRKGLRILTRKGYYAPKS